MEVRGTVPAPVSPEPLLTPTFSLHQELAIKIKSSLIRTRKGSPEVKIEMCFDKLLFDQGLKTQGTLKECAEVLPTIPYPPTQILMIT